MRGFAWWGHTLLAASLVVCLGAACNSPRQYLPIETPDGGGQAKDAPVQSPDASGDRSADGQKDAGVDMTRPEPVETALTYFERLVTELDELL